MRNQANEILKLSKELRDHVVSLKIPMDKDDKGNDVGINIRISDNIRIHYNELHNYASLELSSWPKTVNVALFESEKYTNNTVTINVELVDDVDLESIILLIRRDIDKFKAEKLHNEDVQVS